MSDDWKFASDDFEDGEGSVQAISGSYSDEQGALGCGILIGLASSIISISLLGTGFLKTVQIFAMSYLMAAVLFWIVVFKKEL